MGEAYRGLTVQFKADGSKVLAELRSMSRAASRTEAELRMLKRALRFDASSTKAAQAQLKLLGEKAAAVRAEEKLMRREFEKLGKVEIGGKSMKELAAQTHDANTQAAILGDRYAKVTSELAGQYRQLRKITESTRGLKKYASVFKGKDFIGHDPAKIDEAIDKIGNKLHWTTEQTEAQKAAIRSLIEEFKATGAAYKNMDDIAKYQSFGNKLVEQAAKGKVALREMNEAAKAFRPTEMAPKLAETRADMQRLEAQARQLKEAMHLDPSSFDAAIGHVKTLEASLQSLDAEAEDLKAELRELGQTPGVTEAAADATKLESNLREARSELERIGTEANEARSRLNLLEKEANDAGIDLAKAKTEAEELAAATRLTSANAAVDKQREHVKALGEAYDVATDKVQMYNRAVQLNQGFAAYTANRAMYASTKNQMTSVKRQPLISASALTSMGMQTYSTIYPMAMMAGMHILQSADEIDAAYRNVRKTVQGTDEDFEMLLENAKEASHTRWTSASDLLQIESIGGQLGIQSKNLQAFADTVANLDIATDEAFETEDIALWLGKMSNIMHISADEYDNFADSLVRLGNSEPALESDIANITARFAGMASIVGMTPDEILAIATAATATGQKAESAGGSLMRTIGRIESATAGVSEGMRNLEDMTDEDIEAFESAKGSLEAYAKVADMTSEQFAESWQQDPTKTFQKFVEGLKRIKDEGGSVEGTLQNALGIGSIRDRQLLSGLTQTTDVLSESLKMSSNAYHGISDEYGDAGDAAREAEKKVQGFSGTVQKFRNVLQDLAAEAGDSLLPMLNGLLGIVDGLTGGFKDLADPAKVILTSTLALAAASGPLMTGMGAGMNMINSARASLEKYRSAEQTLARIQGSTLLKRNKTAQSFVKLTNKIDRANRAIVKLDANMAAYEGSHDDSRYKKMQQGKNAAKEKRAQYTMERDSIAKSANRWSMVESVGRGAMSLAKGIGGMAAFSAAVFGIEQLGEAIADTYDKAEKFRKSTEGLREAAEKIKDTSNYASNGIEGQAKALNTITYQHGDYKRSMQELAEEGAALYDSIGERLNGAFSDAELAKIYSDNILDLAGNCGGNADKIAELQHAIDMYNELTGSAISITDNFTGAISASSAELQKNTDLFMENAMAKAYAGVVEEAARQVANAQAAIKQQEIGMNNASETFGTVKVGGKNLTAEDVYGALNSGDVNTFNLAMQGLTETQKTAFDQYRDGASSLDALNQQQADANELLESAKQLYKEESKAVFEKTKALEEQQKYESSPQAYDDALMKNQWDDDVMVDALAEQFGIADENVGAFAGHLKDAYISAELLGNVGTTAFSQLAEQAQQVFPEDGLQTQLTAVQQGMQLVNSLGIDPKYITLTDNGAIVEYQGAIIDFNNKTIEGKSFEVTSDGTFEMEDKNCTNLQKKLDGLHSTIVRPQAILNDQVSGPLSSLEAHLLGLPEGTVRISDNVYEVLGHVVDLNNMTIDDQEFTINDDGSVATAEGEITELKGVLDTVAAITADPTVTVSGYASAIGNIDSVRSHLNALDGKTATTHTYNYTHNVTINSTRNGGGHASGGISIPRNASGGVSIPAYASGAVNGIATMPTLVREGLVGEAGTEALLNMGRRRAIVPLSNRRYVRPFARAVAAEIGGSGGGQPITYNYSINGVQVPEGSAAADALKALYDAIRV